MIQTQTWPRAGDYHACEQQPRVLVEFEEGFVGIKIGERRYFTSTWNALKR